jgi:hypothetical protein
VLRVVLAPAPDEELQMVGGELRGEQVPVLSD